MTSSPLTEKEVLFHMKSHHKIHQNSHYKIHVLVNSCSVTKNTIKRHHHGNE